jgi:hypothetical protein
MSGADTQTCDDTQYRQMIDEILLDELPVRKWEKLRKHLAVCPVCRARYNKAVMGARLLAGGPDAISRPSPGELDRIGQAVLGGAFDAEPAWRRVVQWFAPTPRWATSLAAAAAAIALIPILSHTKQSGAPTAEEFQPRGGTQGPVELYSTHPGAKPTERVAGLRAFCLSGDKVEALDPKGPMPPACPRASQLKLAVSNPGRYARVFLVGMDKDHALKWYAPRPPAPDTAGAHPPFESVPAPVGTETVDVPVGASVRLVVNHDPGPVRIYALFSDQPVQATEVQSASQVLAQRKVPVSSKEAETLPIKRPDVLQRSLLVDVEP